MKSNLYTFKADKSLNNKKVSCMERKKWRREKRKGLPKNRNGRPFTNDYNIKPTFLSGLDMILLKN